MTKIEERPYTTEPFNCSCGRPVKLYWNGGELDQHTCSCGIEYHGEHRVAVLVIATPGEWTAQVAKGEIRGEFRIS